MFLILGSQGTSQREKLNCLHLLTPGGAVVAGLGQACWSLSARVCGHEAVQLAPPVHVVPGGPGSRLSVAAVPPAGRQRTGPAPQTR